MIYQWLLLLLLFSHLNPTYSQQIFTAQFILSNPGTQYIPVVMSAQLISTTLISSVKQCIQLCTNNVLCRVYDYQVVLPQECRLFEGDTNTLGQIVSSSSPNSSAGTLQITSDLFAEYGKPCVSFCYHTRYLQCGNNFTCQCMPHTYWDTSTSMCLPQSPILGASCQQNKSMCRTDLNYTCLQFNQCGPLSVLSGTTVINSTVIIGNATAGLNNPFGIAIFGTSTESIFVVDTGNNRVVGLWNMGTIDEYISVVVDKWSPTNSLCLPYDVYVDVNNGYNMYVSDYCSAQVVVYINTQSINSTPVYAVWNNTHGGVGYGPIDAPCGAVPDSYGNVIAASYSYNTILRWSQNATNSTVICGIHGVASNTSMGLNGPAGTDLDENNSWLYVADSNNHRIQRYSINGTQLYNATTVAGGLGPGLGSNQLNSPSYIKLSKKTGAMYIADSGNNRIQRWAQGATEGVTIAGDPGGTMGTSAVTLNGAMGLILNANETYMYVTDSNNNRVQRFQLI